MDCIVSTRCGMNPRGGRGTGLRASHMETQSRSIGAQYLQFAGTAQAPIQGLAQIRECGSSTVIRIQPPRIPPATRATVPASPHEGLTQSQSSMLDPCSWVDSEGVGLKYSRSRSANNPKTPRSHRPAPSTEMRWCRCHVPTHPAIPPTC